MTLENNSLNHLFYNYISVSDCLRFDKTNVVGIDNNGNEQSVELDLHFLNKSLIPYIKVIENEILLALNSFERNESKSVSKLVITGGLSKLNGLEKRLADLTSLPILNKSDSDYTLKGLVILDKDFEKNKNIIR